MDAWEQEEHKIKYRVNFEPFYIEGFLNGKKMVSVNKRHLLNMEFERNVRENYKFYNKIPVDSTYKFSFDIN
jgi:hypothetical protein